MEEVPTPTKDRAEARGYALEICLSLVLGLATVGTAYSAYQASRYGGNTLAAYSEVMVKTNEANAAEMKSFQRLTMDMLSYNQYKALRFNVAQVVGRENKIKAYAISDLYLTENILGTFNEAVRWSIKKDDDEEVFISPHKYPPYAKELDSMPIRFRDERNLALKRAIRYGEIGDQFTLMSVLFAMVLFFTGIAAVFKREPVKMTLLCLAALLLVITGTLMLMLPSA
jgi:hypothetical protein